MHNNNKAVALLCQRGGNDRSSIVVYVWPNHNLNILNESIYDYFDIIFEIVIRKLV